MEYNKYYQRTYILFEMIKTCRKREIAFLQGKANLRGFSFPTIPSFSELLKISRWDIHKQKIYRSVSTFRYIPKFTHNLKERSKFTIDWFNNYSNDISKYDLFFDFDKIDSWENLIDDVNKLKIILDEYKVPYTLIFSGNKGFQILILGDYVPIEAINQKEIYPHKRIIENIKNMLNLKSLDLNHNGLSDKLCKLPYSLTLPKKELTKEEMRDFDELDMNVVLPLSDEQFFNFNIEDMKLKKILLEISLKGRGELERFNDLDFATKLENTQNFIKLFDLKE